MDKVILDKKIKVYTDHNSHLNKITKQLNKALEAKSVDDWDTFDFNIRGADAMKNLYEIGVKMEQNDEYIKVLKEDNVNQEIMKKQKTEKMNNDYAKVIEKARPLLENKHLDGQSKEMIRAVINKYDKADRIVADFERLSSIVNLFDKKSKEVQLKIVK